MSLYLQHFGVLGMHWGRRKSHADRKSLETYQRNGGMYLSTRRKASALTRAANEIDVKRATSRGLIKPLKKNIKQLSDKEIANILKSPVLKKDLADIDNKMQRNGRLFAAAVIAGTIALQVATMRN